MVRFRHTLSLTAAAVAFTATGALASSSDPASGMPHDASTMEAMHAEMGGHLDHHTRMVDDPAMVEHMASFGVDHGEMAAWIDEGLSFDDLHARLAERGVDVEEMWRTCPMTGAMGGGMGGMHRMGPGPSHADHHGDRAAPTG